VRSDDGERCYIAPPCYRGKTNWGPSHFRIIFLTTVAKVLPIYMFRNKKLGFINIIYKFMMFVFGFCNSKASTQTPRTRTCNYSTLDSHAGNKKNCQQSLVTLRKAKRAKIRSRKIYGDSKCVSNFRRSFAATCEKLKTRIPEEISRLFAGRATDGNVSEQIYCFC